MGLNSRISEQVRRWRLDGVGVRSLQARRGKWEVRAVDIKRGFIFYADLNPVVGSEQGGVRPVLIIQNDIGNRYSTTVIVAAITSQIDKGKLPTHVEISAARYGLEKDSVILLEQIRTIDRQRLQDKVAELDARVMGKIDKSLKISLALTDF